MPDPQVGKSEVWGLEPFQQYKNFFGIIVLQFVGCHSAGVRFDFNIIAPLLQSHCGFSFVLGHGVSFLCGFQHPLVDGCSAASFNFGVLTEGECTSFYSAILRLMNQIS